VHHRVVLAVRVPVVLRLKVMTNFRPASVHFSNNIEQAMHVQEGGEISAVTGARPDHASRRENEGPVLVFDDANDYITVGQGEAGGSDN
jgi:hypothetical protein